MNGGLTQEVLNIIFSKYMVYLSPMIFVLMVALFSERIIDLIYQAIDKKRRWR
ncbi:hypothetical protein [Cytobacillus sp.]|uniref:hypothetical protein n=1 Tax=Cytobacillus sp. TaxID=2675269 RepID=UPI0028BD3414|nr:hypothetical protein [Cytobacillus sp.]